MALRRATTAQQPEIYSQKGFAYSSLNQYEKAYGCLKKAVDPFSPTATYRELATLGKAAFLANKHREAMLMFRLAASNVPAEDAKWHNDLAEIMNVWQIGQTER